MDRKDMNGIPDHLDVVEGANWSYGVHTDAVTVAGWSPDVCDSRTFEIAGYHRRGDEWRPVTPEISITERGARQLAGIAALTSGPAREMLRSMCEREFELNIDYVLPNDGPVAFMQVCRELDEVASLLGSGPNGIERPFEDQAREYLAVRAEADLARRDQ